MATDFTGAQLPESDFANDDGSPDPYIRSVLRNYAQSATAESARNLMRSIHDQLQVTNYIYQREEKICECE